MNNVTERKSKFPTLGSLVDAVQDGQCHNIDCPVDENSFKEGLAFITGTSTDSRVKRESACKTINQVRVNKILICVYQQKLEKIRMFTCPPPPPKKT